MLRSKSLSYGLALFSMFFGAGNVVFPLIVGQVVQGQVWYALFGLILTAVLIPFAGLFSMILFEGDYESFFKRIGRVPGFLLMCLILSLMGPFGGIPRCMTLTYSSLSVYIPSMKLLWFCVPYATIVFFLVKKKSRLLPILGRFLTPLLLGFLLVVIFKGIFTHGEVTENLYQRTHAFVYGLKEGYQTMDLLAAFFFSSLICSQLMKEEGGGMKRTIKACTIGATLLALIYMGFAIVAGTYGEQLSLIPSDQLLGFIGKLVLGHASGFVISMIIALSCLTTVLALSVICADFLHEQIFNKKISHDLCLGVTLGASCFTSTLGFSGIVAMIGPILQVCYPAIVALTFVNVLHKLYDFKPVKSPVYVVFFLMLVLSFI